MKKLLAVLLCAALVFSSGSGFTVPVEAAGTAAGTEKTETARTDGALEIEVRSSLSAPYSGSVSVTICKDSNDGGEGKKTQILDFTESSSGLARFDDVPAGTYTVTITADKFAAYEQKVSVEAGWLQKILVCSSRVNSTDGSAQPGWLRIGDVNGDSIVNNSDKEDLVLAIHQASKASAADPDKEKTTDLNNDGKTDLADLQPLVQSLGEEEQTSVIEQLKIPQKGELSGQTIITQGSISALLNYKDSVTLTPALAEPISQQNPVGLSFTLADDSTPQEDVPQIDGITVKTPAVEDENGKAASAITEGTFHVVYLDKEGTRQTQDYSFSLDESEETASRKQDESSAGTSLIRKKSISAKARAASLVTMDSDGSLILNFGTQLAVKKVTIQITGTKKNESLVTIARVEFVNDMDSRIPAPQLNIPTLASPVLGDKEVSVSWNAQNNVTGYELSVSGPVKNSSDDETQIISAAGTSCTIKTINDKEIQNFKTYTFKVRSVNGDWKSAWSEEVTAKLLPLQKPDKPDNVTVDGGYRSLYVSWKDMEDADGYMVYYKKWGEDSFQPVSKNFTETADGTGKLEKNSYTITGLEDNTSYSIYVKSYNIHGWGSPSLTSSGTTKSTQLPKLPSYKLLNTPKGEGTLTSHIVSASMGGSGTMVNSPLDTEENSALGIVDNDYSSYWSKEDWDDGVSYDTGLSKGMSVTFDNDYMMNYFTFAAADEKIGVNAVKIRYWNSKTGSDASSQKTVGAHLIKKMDENRNPYYIVKLDETITANKIHMCLGRDWPDWSEMKVAEIHFHQYDSLEDNIMDLYADEMHTTLQENVTKETIEELETRLETPDEASGELHPLYSELKLELKTAKEILETALSPSYEVMNDITSKKDTHLGFSGLNAWQPLGKTAYEGETILVYVGHNTKRTGDSANLQLIVTQYHSESSALAAAINLKVGRNEITIPKISNLNFEHGGQLYVAYTGNDPSDKYAIRVSGGSDIPVLNLYGKTGTERTKAISDYIEALTAYVPKLSENHTAAHTGKTNVTDYDYDEKNCILNATDIMMESMMYSIPASQVLSGIDSAEDKVTKLDNALKAMEKTMTLFYQHKGLSNDAGTKYGNNALPAQHLNIRYMRMFSGAFMYAAGNHIGIEWGSTLIASSVKDWSNFGWGIAHEIGHDINQGTYAIPEITNNYFAQLLTKQSTKTTRFHYDDVYQKVTSGTVGRSSNLATQLALYWQLHLMFDDEPDLTIFDNYEDQFNNLFFARVDTYSRNPSKAPQSGLTLGSSADQNLMRLACAAANKNILPFFIRWGMTPDKETTAYAEKYGTADTKALYYVNDDARDYRAEHDEKSNNIAGRDVVTASVEASSNQANVTIHTTADSDLILGYEITRSITSNGKTESEIAGFQLINADEAATVFTDTISSINNRVISYEVRAVDKFLNYSNPASAGSVKIQTEGILAKDLWTAETTMTSTDDTAVKSDSDDPDNGDITDGSGMEAKTVHSIDRIFDLDTTDNGTYHGINASTTCSITIDMHKTEKITSLKYQGSALSSVTVEVSEDGNQWTTVKKNYALAGNATLWFDSVEDVSRDTWIGTYDARYVKLTIPQSGEISIKELDLCAPSGDNLEFMTTENGQPAVGVLSEDYSYGKNDEDYIPKGSLIFTGTYQGNPAYNVVMLYDTQGNVIGAKDDSVHAGQVIFAEVPAQGNLGETSNGTWVYYIPPEQWDDETLKNIQGVRGELYRVDNAITLEGERVVSDTKILTLPDELPSITLTAENGKSE